MHGKRANNKEEQDMITIEQLKDVKERTEALNRYLDIDSNKIKL